LKNLINLSLAGNKIGSGFKVILTYKFLIQNLESLDISDNKLSNEDIDLIKKCEYLNRLTYLNIDNNKIDENKLKNKNNEITKNKKPNKNNSKNENSKDNNIKDDKNSLVDEDGGVQLEIEEDDDDEGFDFIKGIIKP